ncbi:MAG: UDP-N-acetylmuramate dehydrogenase [Alphaproteobacteria bacterium]|nr:MAG: UDP-N-acetylmuramate dehydrogenase [Alphaproteobacteria bacterium]
MDKVTTWFNTPAKATQLAKPKTLDELRKVDFSQPYFCIGAGSNTLIRDGGYQGTVIKLAGEFAKFQKIDDTKVKVGAGCANRIAVQKCVENELSGLEFLVGIPGTIGGAIFMNAGALSDETKDVLVECEIMTPDGQVHIIKDFGMTYRKGNIRKDAIILNGTFQLKHKSKFEIESKVHEFLAHRAEAQPVKGRTGGSTFKNPEGHKAWELIDAVGLRGYRIGDAEFSPKHCNFIMNVGHATAQDIEKLGELARERVREKFGIELEWEIQRVGQG